YPHSEAIHYLWGQLPDMGVLPKSCLTLQYFCVVVVLTISVWRSPNFYCLSLNLSGLILLYRCYRI
uniref:hypothetical protein n=1 Tax=Okeania sp. SIO2F4 TaxID=2607790 RepID=UPI0025D4D6BC